MAPGSQRARDAVALRRHLLCAMTLNPDPDNPLLKPPCTAPEPHRARDAVALRQQLLRVVLRHDGLQDLVADGGQHTLVPVQAQALQTRTHHVDLQATSLWTPD